MSGAEDAYSAVVEAVEANRHGTVLARAKGRSIDIYFEVTTEEQPFVGETVEITVRCKS